VLRNTTALSSNACWVCLSLDEDLHGKILGGTGDILLVLLKMGGTGDILAVLLKMGGTGDILAVLLKMGGTGDIPAILLKMGGTGEISVELREVSVELEDVPLLTLFGVSRCSRDTPKDLQIVREPCLEVPAFCEKSIPQFSLNIKHLKLRDEHINTSFLQTTHSHKTKQNLKL